jgi:heme b synthase
MKPNHPHGHPSHPSHAHSGPPQGQDGPTLRLVAWELTRNCNLSCVHCRASATRGPYENELSTEECKKIIDDIAAHAQPVMIMTGGEPLLREDVFELARYGTDKGLRMVMATNGTLITPEVARKMVEAGVKRISISIDGATAESHDKFRQVEGAFKGALQGIEEAKQAGLEFQINTTITETNLHELPAIQELTVSLGAVAHHIFLLVPTGRGKDLADQALSAGEYEQTLNWFYDQRDKVPLHLKATCAPHYYRILRQRAKAEGKEITFQSHGLDAVTRGCLGGVGFCFVSHRGDVQPCGYLEINCGSVRETPLSRIWRESPVFLNLRNPKMYKGKCGMCEYHRFCGGCRARAHEMSGDYLAEEPLCTYQPLKMKKEALAKGQR